MCTISGMTFRAPLCMLFSAVHIVTKLGLEDRGFVVRFRVETRNIIIHYPQAEAGPTKPPTHRIPAKFSVVVRRPWLRLQLSSFSADVKTVWSST